MKYAVLPLSGSYCETAPLSRTLLSPRRRPSFRFDRFLACVEFLLRNRKIDTILVDHHLDFRVGFPAAVEAIRHQLQRLAASGKKLVYYARAYDTTALSLASVCSERIVHHLGTVRFQGMARSFLFFKRLLEKYDINAEIIRRGRYKSAGDRFRVESLDEHNREQHQTILEATMEHCIAGIEKGLGKSRSEIGELLDGKVLTADEAAGAGWIDKVLTRSKLLEEWRKAKRREVSLRKVKPAFGKGKRVAVLVLEGAIVDGHTRQDPLLGQAIGSDSFVPEIERLTKNKSIKAVILRINSPGGSAIASEELAEALSQLAEKKPLVVSMSGVAGSGGYWVAVPGERIFAEPSTITGSIGVIGMLFSARAGLRRLGVTETTIKIGELADLGSPFKEITQFERSVLEEEIDHLYRLFLEKVATARKSGTDEIHKVAEGRIWAGSDARERGLVDEEGGMEEALEYLRKKLKAKHLHVSFHPIVRYSFIQRLIMRNAAQADSGLAESGPESLYTRLVSGAKFASSFLVQAQGRPLALMPDVGDYR